MKGTELADKPFLLPALKGDAFSCKALALAMEELTTEKPILNCSVTKDLKTQKQISTSVFRTR